VRWPTGHTQHNLHFGGLFDEDADLVERLAGDIGDMAIVAWVSEWDHHVGAFVLGTIKDFAEELHGARGVGEGGEPRLVSGRQEHPGCDADGFVEVVDLSAVIGVPEGHDDDEPWDGVDVGFVGVGLEGFEVLEPAIGGLVFVELLFDLFNGHADFVLGVWVGDGDESPGLFVGARGGGAGGEEDLFDDLSGDGCI